MKKPYQRADHRMATILTPSECTEAQSADVAYRKPAGGLEILTHRVLPVAVENAANGFTVFQSGGETGGWIGEA